MIIYILYNTYIYILYDCKSVVKVVRGRNIMILISSVLLKTTQLGNKKRGFAKTGSQTERNMISAGDI